MSSPLGISLPLWHLLLVGALQGVVPPCLVQARRKLEGSQEKVLSFWMVTTGSKWQACPRVTAPSTGYMWLAEGLENGCQNPREGESEVTQDVALQRGSANRNSGHVIWASGWQCWRGKTMFPSRLASRQPCRSYQ